MKKLFILTAVGALALFLVACGAKTERTPDKVKADVAAAAAGLDAYFAEHSFQNTPPAELQAEAGKAAETFGNLAKEATALKVKTGDANYDSIVALATDGQVKAAALAAAVGAGPAMGDPAKATALVAAIGDWGSYADTVAPMAPGTAAPASGEGPPATAAPAPGETDRGLPGKGHHYGWYKNPAWANDPASRTAETAVGTGEKERDRERKRDGTGGGPDRERERKHNKDAGGPGGGGKGGGGRGGGKGGGGRGGGK